MKTNAKITIAGAGSIGCYVGGCLALAGRDVTLLARPRVADAAQNGLRITDLEGRDRVAAIPATDDAAKAFAEADIILVTVKSGQTSEIAELIERYAAPQAKVVSLQNGVENAGRIVAATLKSHRPVLAGMVAFNVVQSINQLGGDEQLRFHRATAGDVIVQSGHDVGALLDVEGLPTKEADDMASIQWGKLLLNLNNALNALSGLPLAQQLADRDWRRIFAAQMDEALAALAAAKIKPAALAGVSPALLPRILRLPNWLFTRIARRMLAIDPEARSSMWEDLQRRRLTEIDELQGAVERLGATHNVKTPVNAHIAGLVHVAEQAGQGSPGLTPERVKSPGV